MTSKKLIYLEIEILYDDEYSKPPSPQPKSILIQYDMI